MQSAELSAGSREWKQVFYRPMLGALTLELLLQKEATGWAPGLGIGALAFLCPAGGPAGALQHRKGHLSMAMAAIGPWRP